MPNRDRGWQGDEELKGWGMPDDKPTDVPECSAEDSECILALARQVSKGTYQESTLVRLIREAKGIRPKTFPLYAVPIEVRRVGNRWGITYDIVQDKYLVWGGGQKPKGYVPFYRGEVKEEWVAIAADVIRHMPNKLLKFSSFVLYFTTTAANLGYGRGMTRIADCIIQGRIKVAVEIRPDDKIEVLGGHGDKRPILRRG